MSRRLAFTLLLCAVLSGCFRTTYVNLHPADAAPPSEPPSVQPRRGGAWQSFFLYGWVPGDRQIDAAARCGGGEHVESIETRRTFLEGLVAAFAGYYINVYSPWNGRVNCDH